MGYAYANFRLIDGDLRYMAKYEPTHFSGNLEMLGVPINTDTALVFTKKTIRKGKRAEYQYWLNVINPEGSNSINIQLSKKPDNDTVQGWFISPGNQKPLSLKDYCTAKTNRNSIELVFFRENKRMVVKGKPQKLNQLGEPINDEVELFDTIKYLILNSTPL